MMKLFFTTLIISLLASNCQSNQSAKKVTTNRDTLPHWSPLDLFIDTATINKFMVSNHVSDSVETQTNQFYKKRNYVFAWIDYNGAKQAVSVFYAQLKSYEFCFDDSHIKSKTLDFLINSITTNPKNFFSQKQNSEQLELHLTNAFFKFANIAYGGIASNSKNLEWFIPRVYKNYQLLLDSLICIKKGDSIHEPINNSYFSLKTKLIQYRTIDKKKEFPLLSSFKKKLSLGSVDSIVFQVKQHLLLTFDLKANDGTLVFTDTLKTAIKNFQHRMGLSENGSIDSLTVVELRKPVIFRIKQIMLNMERFRWLPITMEKDYLFINIPEFKLHVFKTGKQVWVTNIVVGKSATKTSIFKSNVSQIILNPHWGVPQSIVNKEILPHLKRDSNYLKNNNMLVFLGNNVVYSDTIRWANYTSQVPYTFKQQPGKNNALGKIKFLFPNKYDVYLHDTPAKNLFDNAQRAFSHGCIRVSDPKQLVAYLLSNTGNWTSQKVDEVLKTDKETSIKLTPTIPIYVVYFTSWIDQNGQLNFRNDPYDLDEKLSAEIYREQPKQIRR